MKQQLETSLQQAVHILLSEYLVDAQVQIYLTRPKDRSHGDYACNVAMPLAGKLGQPPHVVAERLLERIQWPSAVATAEIAEPGFINIHLQQGFESTVLAHIVAVGRAYGCIPKKQNASRVCVEFVSANPTGPMHVGHGRGAVVGDAMAAVLVSQGADVSREYYINDAGAQIGKLVESLWFRLQQLGVSGFDENLPEGGYPGEYMIEVAEKILADMPFEQLAAMDDETRFQYLSGQGVQRMMDMIRNDLDAIGISFDTFFSEKSLHESGQVASLIQQLKNNDLIYQGTLPPPKGKTVAHYQPVEQCLFRTTKFGDDVDRPLAKQDGTPTYFAADIAYHTNKHERGFDRLVDVWGADHGGYVLRVQAAMQALTGKKQQPEVVLVQMVNLTRDGTPVRMSKRAGTFVTLREVVDEVGSDAVRFNFLTRRAESQLDFDLEAAKQKNDENPVYYVQYAHARVCAIVRKAEETGITPDAAEDVDVSLLKEPEEQVLIKQLLGYPEVLAQAASRLEPYRVATFLLQLAASLHSCYHKHRVVGEDAAQTQARLLLMRAIQQVLSNGLILLGVHAPERM